MRIRNVENPQELLEVIDSCKGTVELVTEDGDRLNLKSKLCQYVSLTKVFSSAANISKIELVAYEPEDIEKLLHYMIKG